jgi:hypothetical protein
MHNYVVVDKVSSWQNDIAQKQLPKILLGPFVYFLLCQPKKGFKWWGKAK